VPQPLSQLQPRFDAARDADRRAALPSWLLSLVLHCLLLVAMALVLNVAPRGTGTEETRTVGVVLKQSSDNGEVETYEDESTNQQTARQTDSQSISPLNDVQSIKPADALPSAKDVLGFGGGNPEGSALPGASGLLSGPGTSRSISGGKARTQVFGIPAEGFKFVYVFDRSASMAGKALNRAKAELMASLESLGETHQFQIIFYNDQPTIFALAGQPGKLVFGNEPNKRQAQQFIQGIIADRGTEREPALLQALNLAPDVIFFLGDSDGAELNSGQLAKIVSRNRRGTVIHVIEFGSGPQLGENFLMKLARQNEGSYVYVDISKVAR
jgi:hypothetical protein